MIRILRATLFVALYLACLLLVTGCSLPWQHAKAKNVNVPKPTTQQLLASLEQKFRAVSSFHVVLQVQNPGQVTSDRVQIRAANGDVVMPDKVQAQATVILSGQSTTVKLISIGDTQFITDPITGQWRVIKGVLDPRTLTNPDTGIISLVGKVQNVSQPMDDVVGDIPCWRITGQLDAKYIAFFTGGGVPAGTMLQTSTCIGKLDSLPYQLKVTGQASANDAKDTTYLFAISKYNESVTIVAPQV